MLENALALMLFTLNYIFQINLFFYVSTQTYMRMSFAFILSNWNWAARFLEKNFYKYCLRLSMSHNRSFVKPLANLPANDKWHHSIRFDNVIKWAENIWNASVTCFFIDFKTQWHPRSGRAHREADWCARLLDDSHPVLCTEGGRGLCSQCRF